MKNSAHSKDISSKLDRTLVEKAVLALLKHHKQRSAESKVVPLLGLDTQVIVQFSMEIAPYDPTFKPIRVLIPHPIRKALKGEDEDEDEVTGVEEPEVCLIVKEDSKPWVKEMISQFPQHMGFVKKVLGLDSLRKKYSQYSQRRELLHKYSFFLADDRILPMLTQALGRDFFKYKKQPVPISLHNRKSLPMNIHKALSATFMILSRGTCTAVKAGTTAMPVEHLVDNILAIASDKGAVYKIPRRWANIQSICVKTNDSVALPVYNKTPEELIEIAKLAGLDSVWTNESAKKVESRDDVKKRSAKDFDDKSKSRKNKSPLLLALKRKNEADQKRKLEDGKDTPDEISPSKKTKSEDSSAASKEVAQKEAGKEESKSKVTQKLSTTKAKTSNDSKTSDQREKKRSNVIESEALNVMETESTSKQQPDEGEKSNKKRKGAEDKSLIPGDHKPQDHSIKKVKGGQFNDSDRKHIERSNRNEDEKAENGFGNILKSGDKHEIAADTTPSSRNNTKGGKTVPQAGSKSAKGSVSTNVPSPSKDSGKEVKSAFIAARKFSGSKAGYIFQRGKEGIGYYLDVKPKVDPMTLDAIRRMAATNKRSPGNSRRKSGGKHHGGRR